MMLRAGALDGVTLAVRRPAALMVAAGLSWGAIVTWRRHSHSHPLFSALPLPRHR